MTGPRWTYPPELAEALETFGLRPTDETPPALVRDALNDLYRFELRRMRERLRAGAVEKTRYVDDVIALRKKYWPLTMPLPVWERVCRGDA
ncbi:MAG TPA: hypothetical protein VFO19_00990 [Vicinamibacterales bacterium]|nr:hypothetical protein [Vicinamibacterales bacterium]